MQRFAVEHRQRPPFPAPRRQARYRRALCCPGVPARQRALDVRYTATNSQGVWGIHGREAYLDRLFSRAAYAPQGNRLLPAGRNVDGRECASARALCPVDLCGGSAGHHGGRGRSPTDAAPCPPSAATPSAAAGVVPALAGPQPSAPAAPARQSPRLAALLGATRLEGIQLAMQLHPRPHFAGCNRGPKHPRRGAFAGGWLRGCAPEGSGAKKCCTLPLRHCL